MKVKNEMETVVRAEVARLKQGRYAAPSWLPRSLAEGSLSWLTGMTRGGNFACGCPHCAADVLALSLCRLPVRYCLSLHYGVGGRVEAAKVRQQVRDALRRVDSRPRHAARDLVSEGSEIRLVDFGIREGALMVGPLLQRLEEGCTCSRCRADTLAFGLNRFPPRYGVEVQGRLRMPPHEMEFIRHDLRTVLWKAAGTIATNPRHRDRGNV